MRKTTKKCNAVKTLAIFVAVVSFLITTNSFAQPNTTALLIQQTPKGAGTVTPTPGVHRLELSSNVTLTAIPKQGYEFLYWIGDVSDPKTRTASLALDSPKIVIAVFERVSYPAAVPTNIISAPIGGVFASRADYARGGISPIGRRPHKAGGGETKDKPPKPQIPVPNVPEPATICLLGLGGLILLRKKRER